jgi:hypothetical protein
MKWLALHPGPFKRKRKLPAKPLSQQNRRSPMRWRIDPDSQAANALRALRDKLL